MLIENVDGKTPPYHVQSGIGKALVAAGVAKEVIPYTPCPVPNTKWNARPGATVEDTNYPPQIFHYCSSCGNKGIMEGPTAERTQKFYHCGIVEDVPADVQRAYRVLRIAYDRPRSKRPVGVRTL